MASSSSTPLLLWVFTLFTLLFLPSSSSSEENIGLTITLPLTSTFSSKPYREKSLPFLPQAHHSKHGRKTSPRLKTSVSPRRYGFHAIVLSFGTPPQKLSYLLDTGGYGVESPCTANYKCINCSFSAADSTKLPIFDPDRSSSSKILDCRNPKCARTYISDVHVRNPCLPCNANSKNCSRACQYFLQYVKGASSGYFLLENLNFPGKIIRNFQFGCTTSASDEVTPVGVAGMDRSMVSLPAQAGVKKFAYCLKSHDYDETKNSGKLILDYRGGGKTEGLSRAPFLKNPPVHPNFYYLGVKGIKIGDMLLGIPRTYLSPGSDGRNGVIIDSGYSGGGYMAKPVFEIATNELKRKLSKYRRSPEAETNLGLSPCYNFTGHKDMTIPDLTYQFTGGANLVVPAKNYFVFIREISIACFRMATDANKSLEITAGPAIIIGNSAQVDYYLEYDLKNQRLGFRRQAC